MAEDNMTNPTAPATEPTPKKTRRQQVDERLRSKYPDMDFSDEETMYGRIDDDYNDYESRINTYKEREGKMTDLFNKNPRASRFVTDMANGKDPWLAVIAELGVDGVTDLMNDPAKQDAIAEANKEYVERIAKEKNLEDEYQKNFAESMELLSSIQEKRGLTDDVVDGAMDMVMKIVNDAIVGKFSEETIDLALKAMNHDADMDNARSEGMVAGRNEKIEEKLRKPQGGDGMPSLNGSNNVPTLNKRPRTIFDEANDAK